LAAAYPSGPPLPSENTVHPTGATTPMIMNEPDPHLARPQRLHELAGSLVLALGSDDCDQLGVAPLPARGRLGDPLGVGRRANRYTVLRRHGAHGPSTIGTLLREFTFGHARQLESVLREHLADLCQHVDLLPGADERAAPRLLRGLRPTLDAVP
jgi:hypothetical protein